jgi:hypothetical protein
LGQAPKRDAAERRPAICETQEMARFKPKGSQKAKSSAAKSKYGFIPCAIVILLGFVMIILLFYFGLSSSK